MGCWRFGVGANLLVQATARMRINAHLQHFINHLSPPPLQGY